MNKKPHHTSKNVLNKKFETELSGYSAKEVDLYLDNILSDYVLYEDEVRGLELTIQEKNAVIKDKENMIEKQQIELSNLQTQLAKTSEATDFELHERLRKLEGR